ncbi:MAG: hypothetical protein M3Z32_02560 [Acidobacteriota bacterium]|nr:hypothetical protein [Acidobacteriota bacterium]
MTSQRTVVLIPMFNDWAAAGLLLDDLDRALTGQALSPEVLLIDDGSTEPMPLGFAQIGLYCNRCRCATVRTL